MNKAMTKEGFIIELPKEMIKRAALKEGDWLVVCSLEGKEIVLEKPRKDYWEENFAWGNKFAKDNKISSKDVLKAVKATRQGK
jgi:antitoxin component of MazEF toxin-antitoxin module